MRKFIAITTLLLASVIAYGAAIALDDGAPRRPTRRRRPGRRIRPPCNRTPT